MFQDFLEPTKIFIAGCDIIYGLMGAVVVVIFNPAEYHEFWLEAKRPERHQSLGGVHLFAISLILGIQ